MAPLAQIVPSHVRPVLEALGGTLDQDRPIRVLRRGIVTSGVAPTMTDERKEHETHGSRRPAARSRQRPSRRKGAPDRPGSPGAVPWLSRRGLQRAYSAHLSGFGLAYPDHWLCEDPDGMWLTTQSSVLPDLGVVATFLVGIPFTPGAFPRGWAFWTAGTACHWIGPRHTNIPDGSICAFAVEDGVWAPGNSIAALVDFYSVWALRHLFLREFGRWPGRQHAPGAFYRLIEFREGELCSCGSGNTYYECCRIRDLAADPVASKQDYDRWAGGHLLGNRKPPRSISDFVKGEAPFPPSLRSVLPDLPS
jgi:hypothetical protein